MRKEGAHMYVPNDLENLDIGGTQELELANHHRWIEGLSKIQKSTLRRTCILESSIAIKPR